jgi:plastocyanin
MRRTASSLLAGLTVFALAACSGATQSASPSAVASPAATAAVSAEPSESAAASPSASASAAASASASAGAGTEVVGVDYAFEGIPETVTVGTAFTFRNGGQEAHEIVLARKNAGVTTSFEELLAMPEEESSKLVTFVGQLMANPGDTADGQLVADGAGDYLAICFFPQGWTEIPEGTPDPAASPPTGAPHFTLGMLQEFTVQ